MGLFEMQVRRMTLALLRRSTEGMTARALAASVPVVCAAAAAAAAYGQTAKAPSLLDGAYSEEQALHGQELYYAHCLSCHGEDMSGLDQAPPLAGPQFSDVWEGEPLRALVDRIGTMPPEDPGTLSRDETVSVLAYLLWFNGLPVGGVSLSTDRGILEEMTFRTPPLPLGGPP